MLDLRKDASNVVGAFVNNVETWEDKELYVFSVLFDELKSVCPELGLRERNGHYESPIHEDGHRDREGEYCSSIYSNNPHKLFDHATGQVERLTWILAKLRNEPYQEVLKDLCAQAGVLYTFQDYPPKYHEIVEADREQRRRNNLLLEQWHRALISEDTTDPKKMGLIKYLTKRRGWTPLEVVMSRIGYVNAQGAEDAGLSANISIGRTHQLAIPIVRGGDVGGWVFRSITPDMNISKYQFPKGQKIAGFLANIPARVKDGTIIVVEGVLDAIRAEVHRRDCSLDIPPVCACMGSGGIKTEQVADAIKRGVETFVLALDNDDAGKDFTTRSAKKIAEAGAVALVMHLSEGKDLDEAMSLRVDVQKAYKEARPYGVMVLEHIIKDVGNEPTTHAMTGAAKLINNVLSWCDIVSRAAINVMMDNAEKGSTLASLALLCNQDQRHKDLEMSRANAYKKAGELIEKGETWRADKILHRLQFTGKRDILEAQDVGKFETLYPTSGYLETPFSLTYGGSKAPITLPLNGTTIIAARSGHGKTGYMLSLASYLLAEGKKVAYITAECNEREITQRLIDVVKKTHNLSNGEALQVVNKYYQDKQIWMFRERSAEEVCRIAKTLDVDAVFIDYIQLLKTDGWFSNKKDRIEAVCSLLEDAVINLPCAFIIGAQLNRNETTDPVHMDTNNIADAIDIEQFASQIFLLWDSRRDVKITGNGAEQRLSALQDQLPFKLGTAGTLYVKCCKARNAVMKYGYYGCFGMNEFGAVTPSPETTETAKTSNNLGK